MKSLLSRVTSKSIALKIEGEQLKNHLAFDVATKIISLFTSKSALGNKISPVVSFALKLFNGFPLSDTVTSPSKSLRRLLLNLMRIPWSDEVSFTISISP